MNQKLLKISFYQAKIQNDLDYKWGTGKWPMLEIPEPFEFLKEIAERLQIEAKQEKDILKINEIIKYQV